MGVLFPVMQLVHTVKSEIVNEVAHFEGDDDGLIGCDASKGLAIEVIKMRVGDEHQVDRRQFVQVETRLTDALDHLQPLGPVGIDEEAVSVNLDQERCVADPGDSHLVGLELRKNGRVSHPGALGKKGWNEHLREKIPSMPPGTGF